MLLQTLLNDCHKFPGFKYGKCQLDRKNKIIIINLYPKESSKARCSKCEEKMPCYDKQSVREFLFVPLLGYRVKIIYQPRRVSCKKHGVVVEYMPWSVGKRPICKAYAIFLATWSKKISWKEVASTFKTSWDIVFASVKFVVDYGLKNRCLDNIEQIGIDEIKYNRKTDKFATLVFEITQGSKRLLWIGKSRKTKTLLRFFRMLGKVRYQKISVVSSDMWFPYLKVIKKKLPHAIHILDRFHIMKKFNEAIDEMRRLEFKALKDAGQKNPLKNTRWIFLKKPHNLNEKQSLKLKNLMTENLMTYKAYLMRESFQKFWLFPNRRIAGIFMDLWIKMVNRTKIQPMKKVSNTLFNHRDYILNWFDVNPRVSNGVVEGFNNKVKFIIRRAYGYGSYSSLEMALYHNLGNLPEPEVTHSFV